MAELLTDLERLAERARKLFMTYAGANTTLARREVKVRAYDGGGSTIDAPAWSDGPSITFNLAKMTLSDFTTAEGLIATTGLNYHELAHVLYTPRHTTPFRQKVITAGYSAAWNVLEDQRIERLICGRWLSVAPYLSAVFMRYILANKSEIDRVYPLAAGRKHLPRKVRDYLRTSYLDQAVAADIDRIVKAYLSVVHPKDDAFAYELVTQFVALMMRVQPPPDFNGHNTRPKTFGVGTASPQEQASDADSAAQAESNGQLDGSGDPSGPGGEDAPAGDSSNGGSGGNGTGGGSQDDVEELVEQELDRVKKDREVARQVQDSLHATSGTVGLDRSTLPKYVLHGSIDIPPDAAIAAAQFTKEMRLIIDQAAPGYERRQSTGRVNMHRAMKRDADLATIYDRWNPGEADTFDMEVVILADMSSSMRGCEQRDSNGDVVIRSKQERASIGVWVVHRALEMVEGDAMVTTLGYNDTIWVTITDRGERIRPDAIPLIPAQLGTKPCRTLDEARRIFAGSKKKHKVLFLMTDGVFEYEYSTPNANASIEMMNAAGVVTVMCYIAASPRDLVDSRGCLVSRRINTELDFVDVARDVVTRLMRGGIGVV